MRIDDLVIGDLFAIKHKDSALIAFSQFVELLDFSIELDSETSVAAGWYINEGQSFSLNLPERMVSKLPPTVRLKPKQTGLPTIFRPHTFSSCRTTSIFMPTISAAGLISK
ncbi:hypothetical protein P4S64_05285 [Vibrio sp. M60_M31a]